MQISIVNDLSGVSPAAWNALTDGADPFSRYGFLRGLEQHDCLCQHSWHPVHLLAHDGASLIGALPLYARNDSTGEFVFDWSWADAYARAGGQYYPKFVTAIPFTPVTGPRCLVAARHPQRDEIRAALARYALELVPLNEASSWHCLFPLDEELEALMQPQCMLRAGCQYHWFNRDYCDFDDFLVTLNSKRRKEIRRERRMLADAKLNIEVLRGAEITAAHWEVFYRFYCSTFHRKWGAPRLTKDFFLDLNRLLPDTPVLFLARTAHEYLAGAFALHGADTLYGRHWGCTAHVRNLHFELCYYQTIEYCIRHGLRRLDAGAQGEHKIPRGFEAVKTWSVHWIRDPEFRRAVANFLQRESTLIDNYVDHVASNSAYRAAQ